MSDSSFSNDADDDDAAGNDNQDSTLQLCNLISSSTKVSDRGNGLLAKYLLLDGYVVSDIGSGSDVSFVLISMNSSREEDANKARLLKSRSKKNGQTFCDISFSTIDYKYFR